MTKPPPPASTGTQDDDWLPPCPECAAHVDDPPGDTEEAIRNYVHIDSPDDLDKYPGLEIRTQHRHRVGNTGLIARYDFDKLVPCSNPGGHPHKQGLLARTLCGRVIRMGFDCGKRSMPEDFKVLVEVEQKARLYRTHIREIRELLVELPELIETIVPAATNLVRFRKSIELELPTLSAKARTRWESPGTEPERGRMVVGSRRGLDGRTIEEHDTIVGLSAWDHSVDIYEPFEHRVEAAKAAVAGWGSEKPNRRAAEHVRASLVQARESLVKMRQWVERASPFFTPENLARALRDAGLTHRVAIEGGALVVTDRRPRLRIGFEGTRDLP